MSQSRAVTLTAFVLGLTCMLAGVSAQDTTFPYCDCVRPRGVGTGPYLLTPTTTVENPDGTAKVCWALTTNAQATGSCSRFDLRKIELDINLQCRGAARSITFGNQTIAPSYTSYPDVNGMSFKITRGSGDLASFQSLANKTTPVCILLSKDEKCNSLPKFCRNGTCDYAFFSPDLKCCPGQNFTNPSSPPPPPPVSVSPFPYCACDTSPPFNSFSLSPSNTAPTPTRNADGLNTYCWDLSANRYTGNATQCVNYDLKKIEFDINTECQNAVQTVTLDGQKVSPSYSRHPNFNALVFKVTRGTSPIATLSDLVAAPQRLCITLRSFCPTLQSLCATPFCRIAYFSPSNKCCPLQSLVNAA